MASPEYEVDSIAHRNPAARAAFKPGMESSITTQRFDGNSSLSRART
jgi:hypothetical protein